MEFSIAAKIGLCLDHNLYSLNYEILFFSTEYVFNRSNNLDEFDDAHEVVTGLVDEYKRAEKGVYIDWGFDERQEEYGED